MERVVDLLHWLLKRDDCYQSHLISSHRDCNPMQMLFCHSRLKCDMCVMCVPIGNADGCHSIHSKLIEILQPDTQLTWLSNTSIRSLAFGWFQYLLLIYCGSTQCVLVPALCKFSLSTHTFYHSFVHGWHGMMVCLLLWFSQCHFVVQMLLVAKLEIRKFWLKKTCTFSAFAKRKKNRILKLKTSTCSTRSCMFVHGFNRIHLYQLANVKSTSHKNLEHTSQSERLARCVFAWCSILRIHNDASVQYEVSKCAWICFSNISFILIHVK